MFTWGGLETIRVPKTKLPSFATKGPPQPYPGHRNSDKEKLKYEYWVMAIYFSFGYNFVRYCIAKVQK